MSPNPYTLRVLRILLGITIPRPSIPLRVASPMELSKPRLMRFSAFSPIRAAAQLYRGSRNAISRNSPLPLPKNGFIDFDHAVIKPMRVQASLSSL
jgi:hypothetical protein